MEVWRKKLGGAMEEEVYVYGTMDFDATSSLSVSHDKMVIGKEIASGRFAIIKEATLCDNSGSPQLVAAKMTKGILILLQSYYYHIACNLKHHLCLSKVFSNSLCRMHYDFSIFHYTNTILYI